MRFRKSLISRALIQMALRITLVVLVVTAVSYLHISETLENEVRAKLETYITERVAKESEVFLQAQTNHQIFSETFLSDLLRLEDVTSAEFDALFEHRADGTVRTRPELYRGVVNNQGHESRYISGYFGQETPVADQVFRNQVVTAYRLIDRFGVAWADNFANLYVSFPENGALTYWPGIHWGEMATADLDVNAEEWVYIADQQHNPARETVWTGLYYDQTADEWKVSSETPIDRAGKHLLTVGHDYMLNALFERVFNDRPEGAYNFIFREDGRLIAHPEKLRELRASKGLLSIASLNDPVLNDIYQQLMVVVSQRHINTLVSEDERNDLFLAASRIQGPGWWFVTVYPKSVVASAAQKTAEFILMLGVLSIIIEVLALFWVMRSNVIKPLQRFVDAATKVKEGDYQVVASGQLALPEERQDEVGTLARVFHSMAINVHDYRENLEQRVEERTRELEMASQEAHEASEAKSEFLARMSHEIRTPLNAIIGLSNIALKTELNSKQQDLMQKVVASSGSLLEIINDVLDYSKIEAGKLKLERLTFDLDEVFKKLSNMVSLKAHEKGLELLFDIESDVPVMLEGDQVRLVQVLLNLVGNAIKFTSQGEVIVRVSLQAAEDDRVALQFAVKDSGIGIDTGQYDALFKPFTQTDNSITRRYGGTGLGLAICKQLVEMMDGRIWLESQYGSGSCFYFTASFAKAPSASADEDFRVKLPGLRVLVADKNAAACDVMLRALNAVDMRADLAADDISLMMMLEEAISSNAPYQLLLLGLGDDLGQSMEIVRAIKTNTALARLKIVLMIPSNSWEEIGGQVENTGVDQVVSKPVLFRQLLKQIGRLYGGGRGTAGDNDESLAIDFNEANLGDVKVLLVEDNPLNQLVASEYLKEFGVGFDIASNGKEAVAMLRAENYDLVFMDIQMPELDGLTATRIIRKDPQFKSLPIIAMTAHAMSGDYERSIRAGMNDHLTKPLDITLMFETMINWLKRANKISSSPQVPVHDDVDVGEMSLVLDGIDTVAGMKLNLNRQELYLRILRNFLHEYKKTAHELPELINTGKLDEARFITHGLKSSAAGIGAHRLAEHTRNLDLALKNGSLGEYQLKDFSNVMTQVIHAIETLPDEVFTSKQQIQCVTGDLDQLLNSIERLLNQHNMGAVQVMGELYPILHGHVDEELLNRFRTQVQDIEFEAALATLVMIKETMT